MLTEEEMQELADIKKRALTKFRKPRKDANPEDVARMAVLIALENEPAEDLEPETQMVPLTDDDTVTVEIAEAFAVVQGCTQDYRASMATIKDASDSATKIISMLTHVIELCHGDKEVPVEVEEVEEEEVPIS